MEYRLKVFLEVAEKLSFTKASEALFITQPAVTKHIQALEAQLGTNLFERKGNRIRLTEAGILVRDYARKIRQLHRRMEFDLHLMQGQYRGDLKIGASTTIAQYVLPLMLRDFHEKFRDVRLEVVSRNTEEIEKLLDGKRIDVGIVEGKSHRLDFDYIPFMNDRLVPVARPATVGRWPGDEKNWWFRPTVMREEGSGTLEVIRDFLKSRGIPWQDLSVILRYGSTEGIKNFVLQSPVWAYLPLHAIRRELQRNELQILTSGKMEIQREFNLIRPKGQQNKQVEWFVRYLTHYNR